MSGEQQVQEPRAPYEEMQTLRAQTRALFHCVIGLELFLLVEMLVLIVRVFLVGTF